MDPVTLSFVKHIKVEMGELESARARLATSVADSEEARAALEDARRSAHKAFAILENFLEGSSVVGRERAAYG
jgi:hypothetical protein